MGDTQCGLCNEKGTARSMKLCPDCMQYVCENCYDAQSGRCRRCGSREFD